MTRNAKAYHLVGDQYIALNFSIFLKNLFKKTKLCVINTSKFKAYLQKHDLFLEK